MVQVPDKITKLIEEFLCELEIHQIHIDRAILFGSYAAGTFDEWSDIDLALVSESFKGDRFADRDLIREIKLSVRDLENIKVPFTFSVIPAWF